MGGTQVIQPLLGKEGVRPAEAVPYATTDAAKAQAAAQEAPKPAADPAIQRLERPPMAVLEVFKPATQRSIHLGDDRLQAPSGIPARLRSDRVLELLQALGARAAAAPLEPIPQEVDALLRCVHDPRLGGVQGQARFRGPSLHERQGGGGFLRA